MKITYNVDLEPLEYSGKGRRITNEIAAAIAAFVKTDNQNMCVEYDDIHKAQNEASNASVWIRRNNANMIVSRRRNVLYIIKKA